MAANRNCWNYCGVSESVSLPRKQWLEISNFILYGLFATLSLFDSIIGTSNELIVFLAGSLFVLNLIRLAGWHTSGIWQKPLLWSLFISYGFITVGFLLYGLAYAGWLTTFIPVHSFAVGGVGFITLSMMARVSLGHSGRNINEPSPMIVVAFVLLIAAAVTRVFLPIIFFEQYLLWIQASQVLWIMSFGLFLIVYFPVLVQPRVDGKAG